jgi:hypothetical protein
VGAEVTRRRKYFDYIGSFQDKFPIRAMEKEGRG